MSDAYNVNFLHQEGPRVFPCPQCGEEVSTALAECGYCQARLDHKQAEVAAALESRLSDAFSDGNVIRMVGGGAVSVAVAGGLILLRVRFSGRAFSGVPQLAFYGLVAVTVGVVIVSVILAMRWYAKFGRLHFAQLGEKAAGKMQTDYAQSKQWVSQGLKLSGLAIGLLLIFGLLVVGIGAFGG